MSARLRPSRAALAVAFALAAAPLAAQQTEPPPPLPLEEVDFPPFEERTLSNGARLLVVSQHEVPFVTVSAVFRGGGLADPEGMEGMASAAAQLLTKGTTTRSEAEIAEAMDALGGSLGASASDDWLSVSLSVLTPDLGEGLELMADVVMNPTFPPDQLEIVRQQTLSALRVSLGQPASLAGRAFARAVFGQHAYGRLETPASVQAWTRDALMAYHDAWLDPTNVLFVVAGDVTPSAATAALEDAFRGWAPGSVPEVEYGPVPERTQPEVVLVHRPGSVQAVVRAGHLLMEGPHPDWTALSVANQVLGGGASGRLFRVLREERGYTYGAYSSTDRRRDRGVFVATLETRNEVAGEAIEGLLDEIRRIRTEMVPPAELRDTKDFLVGSFPLQIETPQQIASRVTTNRLLGLPDDAIETYRERVAALDPSDIQEVARAHLDPSRLVLVVVGDATQLRSQLQPFGPLTLLDAEGEPLAADALAPTRPAGVTFDASRLVQGTYEYHVLFQGQRVGAMVRELAPDTAAGEPALRWHGTATMGPQEIEQEVAFTTPGFEPLRASAHIRVGPQGVGMDARVENGRLVGTLQSPEGGRDIDREIPDGTLLGDMVELAIWLAPLEEGREIRLPVAQLQTGSVDATLVRVTDTEVVTVPAGTFATYRVEVGGSQPQVVWARVEAPHVIVKVEPSGQPVTLELASLP